MSDVEIWALVAVAAGVAAIVTIHKSKAAKRYRDAFEIDAETPGQWLAALHLRKRSWVELLVYALAPVLFLGILYAWGWWHGDV
jgi:hypothetical protein